MSRRRALLVIAGVWACSAAISFVPIYCGWFADVTAMTLYSDTAADCGLHVNRVYAVVSSVTSFYLPLVVMATVVVMVTVYGRIYRIARRQLREIHKLEISLGVFDEPTMTSGPSVETRRAAGARPPGLRDTKAIKTLGILMGMFCVCWCPFFLVYVVRPFCPLCVFPGPLVSAITSSTLVLCCILHVCLTCRPYSRPGVGDHVARLRQQRRQPAHLRSVQPRLLHGVPASAALRLSTRRLHLNGRRRGRESTERLEARTTVRHAHSSRAIERRLNICCFQKHGQKYGL